MADIKTVSGPWRVCSVERALALVQCSGIDAAARCTTRQGTWVEVKRRGRMCLLVNSSAAGIIIIVICHTIRSNSSSSH